MVGSYVSAYFDGKNHRPDLRYLDSRASTSYLCVVALKGQMTSGCSRLQLEELRPLINPFRGLGAVSVNIPLWGFQFVPADSDVVRPSSLLTTRFLTSRENPSAFPSTSAKLLTQGLACDAILGFRNSHQALVPTPKFYHVQLSNCGGSSWRSGAQAPYRSRLGWSAGALDHVLSPHTGSFHLYITRECEALPFSTKSSHFATSLPLLLSPSFLSQNVPHNI